MQVNKKISLLFSLCQGMFLLSAVLCPPLALKAQVTDSSVKYAAVSVVSREKYCIKESNVIFPDLLQAEKEQSLAYIEKFSHSRRDYLQRMYSKGKKLLPKAAAILKKYDLPEELRVLMTLESAYNANAVSSAGAVGYWQFMDAVAREYGLKYPARLSALEKNKISKQKGRKGKISLKTLSKQKDDRKNFLKSTIAAARYLRDRRMNLDDNWLLVVASYNCGVGNVWNAMERTGKRNPVFWDIKKYLPAETQAYVMNFITLNVIFHNYENFSKNNLVFTPVQMSVTHNEEDIKNLLAEPAANSLQ